MIGAGSVEIAGHEIPKAALFGVPVLVGGILVLRSRRKQSNALALGSAPGAVDSGTGSPYQLANASTAGYDPTGGAIAGITSQLNQLQQQFSQLSNPTTPPAGSPSPAPGPNPSTQPAPDPYGDAVRAEYRFYAGRDPSSQEIQVTADALRTQGQDAVTSMFVNSPEATNYRNSQVTADYLKYLGRPPESAAALSFWSHDMALLGANAVAADIAAQAAHNPPVSAPPPVSTPPPVSGGPPPTGPPPAGVIPPTRTGGVAGLWHPQPLVHGGN